MPLVVFGRNGAKLSGHGWFFAASFGGLPEISAHGPFHDSVNGMRRLTQKNGPPLASRGGFDSIVAEEELRDGEKFIPEPSRRVG